MRRAILFIGTGALALSAIAGCGSPSDVEGSSDGTERGATVSTGNIATSPDALAWRTRARFRGATTTAQSTTPAATSTAAASDVTASAQTADGKAIPQAAGAGGQCPAVVAQYGFWSCVTIGDTCTYTSGGVEHDCTCSRVDGEGEAPEWLCN
ncbi:MAG TPA: hypothetical protein VHU80_02235 [Polyangiaceae bacterium]|jgi:hypothetical protein|nr:hypothetical protein [Polyangiaceae bacterium]